MPVQEEESSQIPVLNKPSKDEYMPCLKCKKSKTAILMSEQRRDLYIQINS